MVTVGEEPPMMVTLFRSAKRYASSRFTPAPKVMACTPDDVALVARGAPLGWKDG